MIDHSDRQLAVELIQEANRNGARLALACKELNISVRTYQSWVAEGDVKADQRPLTKRPTPKNKLTEEEKEDMLEVVKKEEFVDLPPSQIVPKLADQGVYIASESSFYRLLREQKMQHHRGRSTKPQKRVPESHIAHAPNQVWTRDITCLNGPVLGFYYQTLSRQCAENLQLHERISSLMIAIAFSASRNIYSLPVNVKIKMRG